MFSRNLGRLVLAAAIALVLLAAAACERASNTPRPAAADTLPPAVSASMARLLPSVPADCPVTSFAAARPPGQTDFTPTWYGSEETPLWAGLSQAEMGKWFAGQPQKVGWWQPRGRLEIAGRSLDGTARRFSLQDHQVYGPGFNPSIVRVPREGCWEIVGRAGGAELRFVVYAFPSEFAPPLESGRTIAGQVRVSDLVVRAVAGEPLVSDAGFVLHPLRVLQAWKLQGIEPGDEIAVLGWQVEPLPEWWQGSTELRELALDPGEYFLFLDARRGGSFFVPVGGRGWIGEVSEGRVPPLDPSGEQSVDEFAAKLDRIVR